MQRNDSSNGPVFNQNVNLQSQTMKTNESGNSAMQDRINAAQRQREHVERLMVKNNRRANLSQHHGGNTVPANPSGL